MTESGLILPSDLQKIVDGMARCLMTHYAYLGIGDPAETTTLSAYVYQMQKQVLGDGASVYGIGNMPIQQEIANLFAFTRQQARYDIFYGALFRSYLDLLDTHVTSYLPSGWSFGTGDAVRPLDAYLLRANANHPNTPLMPAYTLGTTAATGGAVSSCGTSPTAPRVTITLVGTSDYYESLPCTAVQAASLTGGNNAWQLTGLTGNVPTGVTRCRLYRQTLGAGVNDPYYYEKQVDVTAGAAWSSYSASLMFTKPDSGLILSVRPPSYLSLLLHPESAGIVAMSRLASPFGGLLAAPSLNLSAMLTHTSVAMGPVNGFLGRNNPPSTALFGTKSLSGSYVAGTPLTANDGTNGIQGFVGASNGIRVRVTTALSGGSAANVTSIGYTYLDATSNTSPQSATWSGSVSLSDAVGSVANITIPAGRVVRSVTSLTITGRTSGEVLVEAQMVRSL